jgi:hypothetical protein
MTMEPTLKSNSRTVRIAASLFFFLCVPLSIWEGNVASKIFVPQDPGATANNLLSNESIFRMAILSHLIGVILFVMMALLFYRVFRSVDKHLSLLMLVPILATIPVVFILEVCNFTALMLVKGEPRATFDASQQQEAAYLLMRLMRSGTGVGMGKFLYGLFFIPFGMLVVQSRLAPTITGILLLTGGAGYMADCAMSILLQRADYLSVGPYLRYSSSICYSLALLWFLIRGVREPKRG